MYGLDVDFRVSPVLYQPVVLSVERAVAHGQHAVVHILGAGWVIVHAWNGRGVKTITNSSPCILMQPR